MSNSVDVRRPTLYLVVAGVLALGTLLIPTGGGAGAAPPPEAPPTAGGASAPSAPCEMIMDSLRPSGPVPAVGTAPAGSKVKEIYDRGRLIVGVDQSKYLVGYRDPQTGELQGTDIDIVHRIAEAIFGDPNKVQFVVYDVADRVKAVQNKEVDLVVNTLSITCARQQQIEFSSPYLVAQQRIMVPIGSGIGGVDDLGGQRICTSAGSTTERVLKDLAAEQAGDPMEVVTEANIADCVIRLQQGQVSAVSTDDIILAGLSAQDPQTEVVGDVLDTTDLGIGINKDFPDLVRFVNAVLEQGRADGSLEASYANWLGRRLNPPPLAPAARYRD